MSDEEKPEAEETGEVCPHCSKIHPPEFKALLDAIKALAVDDDEEPGDQDKAEDKADEMPSGAAIFEVNLATGEQKQVAGKEIPAQVREKIKGLMKELAQKSLVESADEEGSGVWEAINRTSKDLSAALPHIRVQIKKEGVRKVMMKMALFHRDQIMSVEDPPNRQACMSWGVLAAELALAVDEIIRMRALLESNGINPDPNGHPSDFLRTAATPAEGPKDN